MERDRLRRPTASDERVLARRKGTGHGGLPWLQDGGRNGVGAQENLSIYRSAETRDQGPAPASSGLGTQHAGCVSEVDGCGSRMVEAVASHAAVAVRDQTKQEDRKSTRLNSSHLGISYAV